MNPLLFLAYHHASMVDWLTHVAIGSVVRGLIYGVIFRVMHRLTMSEAIVLAAVVLLVVFVWARGRDRRLW